MADDFFDISPFINSLPPMSDEDLDALTGSAEATAKAINGCLKGLHDFTINFDMRPVCGVCQQRFWDGPEGVPELVSNDGSIRLKACPPCAVALMQPD